MGRKTEKLFEKEGDSDDDGGLKINKDYADRYDRWREKEEYEKLKSKYGEAAALSMLDDNGSDSSSTSEDEDENGEGWTPDVERDFLHTLASLKTKDPSIYATETKFFSDKEIVPPKKSKDEEKTMFLRDYERKIIVEKGGKFSDDEEEQGPSGIQTYSKEQDDLKKDFRKALAQSDSEDDDLLTIRKKTEMEKEKEDDEFKEWLKGNKGDITNQEMKKKLKPLKDYWSNPNLDENEKFLRDFVLNKRYLEENDKNYIPTYDEIVHDSEDDLSEDERTLEKQIEFETKYNFRFEEPDPEFIKRYPRTIADSLRKPDDKRKVKREEIREKKKKEKEVKKEELKQLKKFKLNEIKEKLEQLKSITGNDALPFQDEEFDEDFDPEKHDKKMQEIFNDQYYQVDEGEQKPEFPFDEEIDDENWDEYTGETGDYDEAGPSTSTYEPHCEDPDFNMDCDYDSRENTRQELIAMSSNKRVKKRRKSVFAQKVEAKKPVFDPQKHPNFEEYLEEYYKLDFEDIIGDMPVRFKYRQVVPNDFGLDTEEILSARDKELNRWCSVKKTCQYRAENEEIQDVHTFRTKKNNIALKKKLLPSLFAENPEELLVEDQEIARRKRRRNQGKEEDFSQPEAKKLKQVETDVAKDESTDDSKFEETPANVSPAVISEEKKTVEENGKQLSKKKKKKKKKNTPNTLVVSSADSKQTNTSSTSTQQSKGKMQEKDHTNGQKPIGVQKKKSIAKQDDYSMGISDERLKAYGFNPKKFKNQKKYGKASKS